MVRRELLDFSGGEDIKEVTILLGNLVVSFAFFR